MKENGSIELYKKSANKDLVYLQTGSEGCCCFTKKENQVLSLRKNSAKAYIYLSDIQSIKSNCKLANGIFSLFVLGQ